MEQSLGHRAEEKDIEERDHGIISVHGDIDLGIHMQRRLDRGQVGGAPGVETHGHPAQLPGVGALLADDHEPGESHGDDGDRRQEHAQGGLARQARPGLHIHGKEQQRQRQGHGARAEQVLQPGHRFGKGKEVTGEHARQVAEDHRPDGVDCRKAVAQVEHQGGEKEIKYD